jgi:hypothetical protein
VICKIESWAVIGILLKPVKLRWLAHALKLHHIDEFDKADSLVIVTVPPISLGAVAIPG